MRHGRCGIGTILSLALLTLPTWGAGAETLHLLTEDSGRFGYVEGNAVKGIMVDLMREVAGRAGVDASIDLLPWKRAYDGALTNPDTCVFSTTMTPDRLPLFKWVAPMIFNNWALLALKSRHIRLARLEDARPYVVGVYQGDARESYLRQRGFMLAPVNRNELNIAGLTSGRIDLWASSSYTPIQMGPDIADKVETVLEFRSVELGLACNMAVPDTTIARLNQALAQVRAEHGYSKGDGSVVEDN
jgi:polar amino acid transport system substrate-binding protein